jgi:hypothetical protein
MNGKLFSFILPDGSRNFADLPEFYPWESLREHLKTLYGSCETGYVSDGVTEFWLDFNFYQNKFSINNQLGEFWFIVNDPNCPDEILIKVIEHFEKMY